METLIAINTNEDLDLLEDIEEREEAQEDYETEIEKVHFYLSAEEDLCEKFDQELLVEQIDDYRFLLTVKSPYSKREHITNEILQNIESILAKADICYMTTENMEYIRS